MSIQTRQVKPARPAAVTRLGTIVTVLGIVGVILSSGIFALSYLIMIAHVSGIIAVIARFVSELLLVLAVIVLIPAALTLLVGYGLLTGRAWAYPIGIIVSVIDVITAFLQFGGGSLTGIFDLIVGLWMLTSLMKPDVKAYFGKTVRRESLLEQ